MKCLIAMSQRESFAGEMSDLKIDKSMQTKGLRILNPFLDDRLPQQMLSSM